MTTAMWLAMVLACGSAPVPAPETLPDCPRTGALTMPLPDAPEDAVFQFMTSNREGDWRGFRVMADGRLFRTSRAGAWEEDTPLDATRLASVKRAVAAAKLSELPAQHASASPADDAKGWSLHAGTGVAMGGKDCRPPAIDALIEAVAPLLSP